MLWVVDQGGGSLRSQIQWAEPDQVYQRQPTIPIFRLDPSVAQAMLKGDGLAVSDLLDRAGDATQSGSGWFARDLSATVGMSLALSQPQAVEIPCVLGFKQGTDYELGGEVVVLLAGYDGLGREPDGTVFPGANHNASGVGMLLEIARLWQQQNLDPRRSVLFVAWGGGELTEPGLRQFLRAGHNFRHLSSLITKETLEPAMVIQPDCVGAGGDTLWIHPRSNARLFELLEEAAAGFGVSVVSEQDVAPIGGPIVTPKEIPWLYFSWSNPDVLPDQDNLERIESDKLQSLGEALALALMRIVRETDF